VSVTISNTGAILSFSAHFFASRSIVALDGINTGDWVNHHWKQFYAQVTYMCAMRSYTFVVTALISNCIITTLGLHLRTMAEDEKLGFDEVNELCESCCKVFTGFKLLRVMM
jgi:Amt family ammonium transporter